MREIKFRAKHTDGDLWIFGAPWKFVNEDNNDDVKWLMLSEDSRNKPIIQIINPETIGQYTGLTDKNGKEIYEGSIVECTDSECCYEDIGKYVVVWNTEECRYMLKSTYDYPNGFNHSGFDQGEIDALHLIEIGSVYENPELLEGE